MPRYTCPGNPDCTIECPAGGGATFHEPFGPCDAFCEDSAFGTSILGLGRDDIINIRLSGILRHYPMRRIGIFARALAARDLHVANSEISTLIELSNAQPRERIDARWLDADLSAFLGVLIAASPLRPA